MRCKISKYMEFNEKRLEHPDLFTFEVPATPPAFPFRWTKNKVDLCEILLALYHSRALMTPDGMYPTYTDLVEAAGSLFEMSLGESADMARKVRERGDRAKFLHTLSNILTYSHE